MTFPTRVLFFVGCEALLDSGFSRIQRMCDVVTVRNFSIWITRPPDTRGSLQKVGPECFRLNIPSTLMRKAMTRMKGPRITSKAQARIRSSSYLMRSFF